MGIRSFFRKVGWNLIFFLSLGAVAQNRPKGDVDPAEKVSSVRQAMIETLGYDPKHSYYPSEGVLDAAVLTRLSMGNRTPDELGFRFDGQAVRHVPVSLEGTFQEPLQNVNGSSTNQRGLFLAPVLQIEADDYLAREREVFGTYAIKAKMTALSGPPSVAADASLLGHEARHVLLADKVNLTQLLSSDPRDRDPQNTGNAAASKLVGFGPIMDAILASEETAAQTAARQEVIARLLVPGHLNEGGLKIYPLLYTELRSFLAQNVIDPVLAGDRAYLPKNREQLWAAVYSAVGGPTPDAAAKNPVSRYLASEEGKKALQEFAYPDAPWLRASMSHIELKAAIDQLSERQKAAFFEKNLPSIYADLMQDQGCIDAIENLGLQPGTDYGLVFGDHLIHDGAEGMPPWKPEDWKQMGAQVEPKYVLKLAELAVVHRNHDALEGLMEGAGQLLSAQDRVVLQQLAHRVSLRPGAGPDQQAALENVALLQAGVASPALAQTTSQAGLLLAKK